MLTMTMPCLPVLLGSKDIIQSKSASSVVRCGNDLGRNLKTPIQRFFFKFEALKSSASGIGNKRSRIRERGNDAGFTMDPLVHSPPLSSDVVMSPMTDIDTPGTGYHTYGISSPRQQCTSPVPCMALQNSDHSVDAIVISTLFKPPFCRHEDLLTMSPARVVEVAQEINERLPEVLKIDLKESHDHNGIRREVERLVGMVKSINGAAVPGAPLKRVKSKSRRELGDVKFLGHSDVRSTGQSTSPLVIISETKDRRRLGQGYFKPVMSPTKLTKLQEEEEDSYDEAEKHAARLVFHSNVRTSVGEDVFRAAKKRRSSVLPAEIDMTTPTMCHIKLLTRICDDINDASQVPPRIRDLSLRRIILNDGSSAVALLSGKVIVKTTVIDRSLVNTRPRYRSSSHAQNALEGDLFDGSLRTSTPKFARMEHQSRVFAPIQRKLGTGIATSKMHRSTGALKPTGERMYPQFTLVGVSRSLESDGKETY